MSAGVAEVNEVRYVCRHLELLGWQQVGAGGRCGRVLHSHFHAYWVTTHSLTHCPHMHTLVLDIVAKTLYLSFFSDFFIIFFYFLNHNQRNQHCLRSACAHFLLNVKKMLITFWGKRAHAWWYSPKWPKTVTLEKELLNKLLFLFSLRNKVFS